LSRSTVVGNQGLPNGVNRRTLPKKIRHMK
jgi:hypothetical protein